MSCRVAWLLAACLLSACVDPGDEPFAGESPDAAAPLEPTFSSIESNVFMPRCAFPGCHGDQSKAASLDLESDPFSQLVGARPRGAQCKGEDLMLVASGDPQASLLFLKLRAKARGESPPCGSGMPLGAGGALSDAELGAVEQWILDGAPDD